ncbi:XVIPCD domain-containing protein, partial [Lysobacter sp. 2RAB21]
MNLSAALTADAKRDGLSRIDRIEFNDTGKFARAVEIYPHMNEPALNRNTLPQSTEQGIQQSVQTSTEQLAQVSGNVPSREQVPSPMAQPQQ